MVPSSDGIFVGGSVNSLLNLIRATSSYCEATIYAHTDIGRKGFFKTAGINCARFVVEENKFNPGTLSYGICYTITAIRTLITNRGWSADIIHGHSGYAVYAILTALAGKLLKKPTIHSLYCPINSGTGRFGLFDIKLSYIGLSMVDKILAMSTNIRSSLLRVGIPFNKIHILRPYVDIDKFHPLNYDQDLRNKLEADDKPIILFVGNLKHSKGLDLLIKALGVLVSNKQFRFVFTTELEDKSFRYRLEEVFNKAQSLNLGKRTTHLKVTPWMASLLASVDLIVIPYRNTTGPSDYPLVLLEAMACGIPAIGTRVGGIPEIIENGITGILIEPGNQQALVDAITKLLDSPEQRKKMGIKSREKCVRYFDCRTYSNMVKQIYEDLLGKKSYK